MLESMHGALICINVRCLHTTMLENLGNGISRYYMECSQRYYIELQVSVVKDASYYDHDANVGHKIDIGIYRKCHTTKDNRFETVEMRDHQ